VGIEKAKADSQTKGWIFFVATQVSADPAMFLVNDYPHLLPACKSNLACQEIASDTHNIKM